VILTTKPGLVDAARARHKASAPQATAGHRAPILAAPRCRAAAALSLPTLPLYPCQNRNRRQGRRAEPLPQRVRAVRRSPTASRSATAPLLRTAGTHADGTAPHAGTQQRTQGRSSQAGKGQGKPGGDSSVPSPVPGVDPLRSRVRLCELRLTGLCLARSTLSRPSKGWEQPRLPLSCLPAPLPPAPGPQGSRSVPAPGRQRPLPQHRPPQRHRAAVGTARAKESERWFLTPHEQTRSAPTPTGLANGHLPGLGTGTTGAAGALRLQPQAPTSITGETSSAPGTSPKAKPLGP